MPDVSISATTPGAALPVSTGNVKEQVFDEAVVRSKLIEIVSKYTGILPTNINEQTNFKEAGLDSLDLAEMSEELDSLFEITLPNNIIDAKTMDEVFKAINKELSVYKGS